MYTSGIATADGMALLGMCEEAEQDTGAGLGLRVREAIGQRSTGPGG